MCNVDATNGLMVTYYCSLGSYVALCTGNPGNTSSIQNECIGGSPAYVRKSTAWTINGAQAIGTPVTFNVPPGTYRYAAYCSGSSGNNMIDWVPINPMTTPVQNTLTITPTSSGN